MKDGVSYFGNYNNVIVGIKLNDGKIATIFPDCKQDSKIIKG